jgi:hydrogenase 3 maturation protease
MLEHLKPHLKGRVVIIGIGNTLRSDDGAGSILAARIKDKVPFQVWDVGASPENYLEKIIQDRPDTLLVIDVADFGAQAGEFRLLEADSLDTINLFSTHNASLTMLINYLQDSGKMDIIILIIQPKSIAFGDKLSPDIQIVVSKLEDWFLRCAR